MKVEVNYIIQKGKEKEALETFRKLNAKGMRGQKHNATSKCFLFPGGPEETAADDSHFDHLSEIFSRIRPVSATTARVNIRLTS